MQSMFYSQFKTKDRIVGTLEALVRSIQMHDQGIADVLLK